MSLKERDRVKVLNTTMSGISIEEGIAVIMRVTKRPDYYMVKFISDGDNGELCLRCVLPEQLI